MKFIFLSLVFLSGATAQAQHQGSQASQVITFRLQPVSFIDLSSANAAARQSGHTESPLSNPSASSVHEIIINKNSITSAALPAPAAQQDGRNSYRYALAYNSGRQDVYTFSSR